MLSLKKTILILASLLLVISTLIVVVWTIEVKQIRGGIGERYWKMVSKIMSLPDDKAIAEIQRFMAKYPKSDYVEDASYNICKIKFRGCLNNQRDWKEAIEAYSNLLLAYQEGHYLEPANFFLAMSYAHRGNTLLNGQSPSLSKAKADYLMALNRFKQFIRLFPNSDLADEAKYNSGRLYWALNMPEQALQAYQGIVKKHSNDDLIDESYYRIAEVYLQKKMYDEAKQWLKKTMYRFSRGKIAPYAQSMLAYTEYLQRNSVRAVEECLKALTIASGGPIEKEIKELLDRISLVPQREEPSPEHSILCLPEGIAYVKRQGARELLFFTTLKETNLLPQLISNRPLKGMAKDRHLSYPRKGRYVLPQRPSQIKEQFYQGRRHLLLTEWQGASFLPMGYDKGRIIGVLKKGGVSNLVEVGLRDGSITYLTRQGGRSAALSGDKSLLAYKNQDNIWLLSRGNNPKCRQLTLTGGKSPAWLGEKVLLIREKDSLTNWWNCNLWLNKGIRDDKGRVGKEYLLDVITQLDLNEGLWLVDIRDLSTQRLVKGELDSFAVSRSGEIVIERKERLLWLKDSQEVNLTEGGRPCWSPDGKRIAFERNGLLWIIEVESRNEARVAEIKGSFSWSSDGTNLVYSKDDGCLYLRGINRVQEMQLTK